MTRGISKKDRSGLRTWIEIDRKAIRSNFRALRTHVPKTTKLLAVVKSNAYGHDLIEFSREMERLGVEYLGVDSGVEALALHKAGIRTPILVLGYTLPEMLEPLAKAKVAITISSFDGLREAIRCSRAAKRTPAIHLKVDTGMHRQGFLSTERDKLVRLLATQGAKLSIAGLYTHFAAAKNRMEPKHAGYTHGQIAAFNEWRDALVRAGFTPITHAGATAGLLLFPEAHFDMVRAGIGFYGVWPSENARVALAPTLTLIPILSWKSIIAEVKHIPKGRSIGYDLTETVVRDTTVAIIPIGYWHGYPRALSGKGEVLVRGKRARVLGRVCMDMIIVDVTGIPGVRVRDEVVLVGVSGNERVSAEELAERSGTSAYEILTRLNPLMRRLYL